MLTVHQLNRSRSDRTLWLVEEIGIDYKLVFHTREESGRSPDSLRAVHPFGKAPTIEDDGAAIVESGAILEYIAMKHGGGRLTLPPSDPNYGAYLQWLHYAEGSGMSLFMQRGAAPDERWARYREQMTAQVLKHLDELLAKQPFLAGNAFTIADINMWFAIGVAKRMENGPSPSNYPHLNAYFDRLCERPAYKRMVEIKKKGEKAA